jgi:hypothetical protein
VEVNIRIDNVESRVKAKEHGHQLGEGKREWPKQSSMPQPKTKFITEAQSLSGAYSTLSICGSSHATATPALWAATELCE